MDEFTNQNNPQQPESVNNSSVNHATSPQPNPYYQNQGFAQQNYNQQGNMPYATSPAYKNENELKEEYFQKAIQNYKLMNCKEEIAHMEEEYV